MLADSAAASSMLFSDADRDHIVLLREPPARQRCDIRQMLAIKSRICGGNRSWMDAFVAAGGIEALVVAISRRAARVPMSDFDAAMLFELVRSLSLSLT